MSIPTARLDQQEVVEVYSEIAPVYDTWGRLTETRARKRALARANIQNGEAVLEVAVGTGMAFQQILRANPDGRNVGVDLTPAMLDKARARAAEVGGHNYQLVVGDAHALEFPDESFDVLVNSYMFDLLPEADFVPVLQEFKRVLKPNGRMVLTNMTRPKHFYQRVWGPIYQFNPRLLGGCRGVLLSPSMQAIGLREIRRETVSQFGFPSEIITARK